MQRLREYDAETVSIGSEEQADCLERLGQLVAPPDCVQEDLHGEPSRTQRPAKPRRGGTGRRQLRSSVLVEPRDSDSESDKELTKAVPKGCW